jgi:hypothetical protein
MTFDAVVRQWALYGATLLEAIAALVVLGERLERWRRQP